MLGKCGQLVVADFQFINSFVFFSNKSNKFLVFSFEINTEE